MGSTIKHLCDKCGSLYDNQAEADACSTGTAFPAGTKYLTMRGPWRGVLALTRIGNGCTYDAYVKPAPGFRDAVSSLYRPNPGSSAVRVRVRKGERHYESFEPATVEELTRLARHYTNEANRARKEGERNDRLAKRCLAIAKEIAK